MNLPATATTRRGNWRTSTEFYFSKNWGFRFNRFNKNLDSTPGFLWMITEGNDRKTQVNAGRAYVRIQLSGTADGISMHPLQQALQEYPEQQATYKEIYHFLDAPSPRYTVQMWARLGYGPQIEPASRRGLEAHIAKS